MTFNSRSIRTASLILALCMPVAASERPAREEQRPLTGTIIRVDRTEHCITVREDVTGQETVVRIPEGNMLRLRRDWAITSSSRFVPFEHAIRGMRVDLEVIDVEASDR